MPPTPVHTTEQAVRMEMRAHATVLRPRAFPEAGAGCI